MFDNIHLYILIGIIGSITPILDKHNLNNFKWFDYLCIRELFFFIFLLCLTYNNDLKIINKIKKLDTSKIILLLIGCSTSIIYISLIFKTFELEFKKQAISKVVTIMIIITMIATFMIDLFYYNTQFNNYNYLGLLLLILGIYFLKGF